MWDSRHALISSRCSWCSRIWTGRTWEPDRRQQGRETYANGICLDCTAAHFPAKVDRARLNVERFAMQAKGEGPWARS
ncbi:MAG TPA: hypothetical protein VK188_04500 [Holophaga sp.]|nr:hypothetical protein [Holophaga sp.]